MRLSTHGACAVAAVIALVAGFDYVRRLDVSGPGSALGASAAAAGRAATARPPPVGDPTPQPTEAPRRGPEPHRQLHYPHTRQERNGLWDNFHPQEPLDWPRFFATAGLDRATPDDAADLQRTLTDPGTVCILHATRGGMAGENAAQWADLPAEVLAFHTADAGATLREWAVEQPERKCDVVLLREPLDADVGFALVSVVHSLGHVIFTGQPCSAVLPPPTTTTFVPLRCVSGQLVGSYDLAVGGLDDNPSAALFVQDMQLGAWGNVTSSRADLAEVPHASGVEHRIFNMLTAMPDIDDVCVDRPDGVQQYAFPQPRAARHIWDRTTTSVPGTPSCDVVLLELPGMHPDARARILERVRGFVNPSFHVVIVTVDAGHNALHGVGFGRTLLQLAPLGGRRVEIVQFFKGMQSLVAAEKPLRAYDFDKRAPGWPAVDFVTGSPVYNELWRSFMWMYDWMFERDPVKEGNNSTNMPKCLRFEFQSTRQPLEHCYGHYVTEEPILAVVIGDFGYMSSVHFVRNNTPFIGGATHAQWAVVAKAAETYYETYGPCTWARRADQAIDYAQGNISETGNCTWCWHAPPSPSGRYMYGGIQMSRLMAAHNQQDLMHKFGRLWGQCNGDAQCMRAFPVLMSDGNAPLFRPLLDDFLRVMPEVNVVWHPENEQHPIWIKNNDKIFFPPQEFTHHYYPCRMGFVSRIYAPRVKRAMLTRDPKLKTYDKVAVMKIRRPGKENLYTTWDRVFPHSDSFLQLLRDEHVKWIDDLAPREERSWYLTNAKVIITTWGGTSSIIGELTASEFRRTQRPRIVVLMSATYDGEPPSVHLKQQPSWENETVSVIEGGRGWVKGQCAVQWFPHTRIKFVRPANGSLDNVRPEHLAGFF